MGSHMMSQTTQPLIKQVLLGATFIAASQFIGDQCYPLRVCFVTAGLLKLLIVLFQLTVTNNPDPPMCNPKGRYSQSPRPVPVTFYSLPQDFINILAS